MPFRNAASYSDGRVAQVMQERMRKETGREGTRERRRRENENGRLGPRTGCWAKFRKHLDGSRRAGEEARPATRANNGLLCPIYRAIFRDLSLVVVVIVVVVTRPALAP